MGRSEKVLLRAAFGVGAVLVIAFFASIHDWSVQRGADPAKFGPGTLRAMKIWAQWAKAAPAPPRPEEKLASLFRETFAPLDVTGVKRDRFANSVSIYTSKETFQSLPFPERPAALQKLAARWCKDVPSYTWITRLRVRDIRSGATFGECGCP
jgi:hypothetical protein